MNILKNGGIALAMVLFLAVPFAARAADIGDGGYTTDYFVPDATSYDAGYTTDYFVPNTTSYDTGYTTDYFVPDATSYDTGYTQDYFVPNTTSYGSGYSTGYLGGSGYSGSGYITGSGYLGSSYIASRPSYIPSAPTNINTNTNTNTNIIDNGNSCTATNSCNTSTNIVTNNPAPVINNVISNPPVYTPPPVYNYPACNTCGCPGYSACYHPPVVYQNPPIAYNATPYISLSEAPYTGLDLGFWGTIAYWGFLILWCFVAAYLVVVKKVQNRILRSLSNFLFGDYSQVATASHAVAAAAPVAAVHSYSAPVPTPVDAIDPFIMSQINRVRA